MSISITIIVVISGNILSNSFVWISTIIISASIVIISDNNIFGISIVIIISNNIFYFY